MVDATASMGSYLTALRKSLPQILAVSALTDAFSRIGLLAYRDYDEPGNRVIEWSGWHDGKEQEKIIEMAANIQLLGGYSVPEAVKTGLAEAYEVMRDDAENLILLYADAPPHHANGEYEPAAQAEEEALTRSGSYGNNGANFLHWPLACEMIARKAKVICILHPRMPMQMSTFFTWLCDTTQGTAIMMSKSTDTSISQVTMDVLLAWMGVAIAGSSDHSPAGLADRITFQNPIRAPPEHVSDEYIICEGHKELIREPLDLADVPRTTTTVQDFAKRYVADASYRDHVALQLQRIIETNVSAISLNPIFGSLWRTVCNDRASPHRESLASAFGLAINRLRDADEEVRMKEWLDQSYDYSAELLGLIEDIPLDQRYPCVCLDPTLSFVPTAAVEDIPYPEETLENAALTRRDLLEIGRSCDPRVLRRLGTCLTRLTYIDSEARLPPHLAAFGIENVPRIPLALAKKEYGCRFWKILLHLVVPGTMLSARPAAILAAISLKMGFRPLINTAVGEILLWRNRWSKSLDYPETWNASCLSLLLDANQAHRKLRESGQIFGNQSLLRSEDVHLFETLIAYKMLDMNLDTNLAAKVGWTPDKTALPIGPTIRCIVCCRLRSVTIMGPGSICGLCSPTDSTPECEGSDTDEQTHATWLECNARGCRAQYVVYRPALLNVRPKCFYCRSSGSDSGPTKAPFMQCSLCLNRIIYPEEYRPEGLDAHDWRCIACESGRRTIVEIDTTARILAAENGKSWLLMHEGALSASFGENRSLFYAVSTLGFTHASAMEILPEGIPDLRLDGKSLHNTASIREQLQHWIKRRKVERGTCTLCFSTTRKSNLHLACGRSGCTQRLDDACLSSWYGLNRAGCIINTAALHCPFCRRAPTTKTLACYGKGVHAVQDLASTIEDPTWIWAWCKDCGSAKRYVERLCVAGAPEIRDWKCDECAEASTDERHRIKPCPGCQQPTEKTGGCNHIACTICHSHWCFVCGWLGDEKSIYSHMGKEHGGFFDVGAELEVEEMEWEYEE